MVYNPTSGSHSRRRFLHVLGNSFAAALCLVVMAGCDGSKTTGSSGGSANPFAGSYQGVYLYTSGKSAPNAGTVTFTVDSTGAFTGATQGIDSGAASRSNSGTISSSGVIIGTTFSGTLSQNTATHVFSAGVTGETGATGQLNVGLVPANSALTGAYTGTALSTGGVSSTLTLTINASGAASGSITQAGNSVGIAGYVDATQTLYLVYHQSGYTNAVGTLALNGSSLSGSLAETTAGSASNTLTLALTKQ